MEEYSDKIIYIVIAIIIFVFNSITKAKKNKEKQNQPIEVDVIQATEPQVNLTSRKSVVPNQKVKSTSKKVNIVESKNSASQQNVDSELVHSRSSEIEEFDIRKAVIYSEILNRKY